MSWTKASEHCLGDLIRPGGHRFNTMLFTDAQRVLLSHDILTLGLVLGTCIDTHGILMLLVLDSGTAAMGWVVANSVMRAAEGRR